MVIEMEEKRKSQHLPNRTNEQACRHCCEGIITSEGGSGQPGNGLRAPLGWEEHHALQLADEVQRSMRLGKDGFSLEQQEACDAWDALCQDGSANSMLRRLGREDGNAVDKEEMKHLIGIFSGIFFRTSSADAHMSVSFRWRDWTNTSSRTGSCRLLGKKGLLPMIKMCAFKQAGAKAYGSLNGVALGRLGTLLHELVHAYLDYYACHCEDILDSYETNVMQLRGHGYAWQRIASSIEHAAPEILGYPLDLHRFRTIKRELNWKELKHWPSQEEVESWQLVDRVDGRTEEDSDNESTLSSPPDSDLEMADPVDRPNDRSLIVILRLPRRV